MTAKKTLITYHSIPLNQVVDIYGDNTRYIDYDVIETISNFRQHAAEHDILLTFKNLHVEEELDRVVG